MQRLMMKVTMMMLMTVAMNMVMWSIGEIPAHPASVKHTASLFWHVSVPVLTLVIVVLHSLLLMSVCTIVFPWLPQ